MLIFVCGQMVGTYSYVSDGRMPFCVSGYLQLDARISSGCLFGFYEFSKNGTK
jgi:hypothetical protein